MNIHYADEDERKALASCSPLLLRARPVTGRVGRVVILSIAPNTDSLSASRMFLNTSLLPQRRRGRRDRTGLKANYLA